MRVFSLISLVALIGQSNAVPAPAPAAAADKCSAVNLIVAVLKLQKATPFCSTFIGLKPITSTSTVTAYATTDVPVTAAVGTVTSYTSTEVSTVLQTTVTGTVASTVSVYTVIDTAHATITVTPAPVTVTVVTAGGVPIKRSVALEERAATLPAYLKSFASAAVSSACSCLSIPISTVVAETTSTSTATITSTISSTATVYAVKSLTITQTVGIADVASVTGSTTTTTTYTATASAAASTSTFIVCDSQRLASSTRNLAGGDDFGSGHGVQYDGETAVSCCVRCYTGLNCLYGAIEDGHCFLFYSDSHFNDNDSATCPNGVSTTFGLSDNAEQTIFTGPCANHPEF